MDSINTCSLSKIFCYLIEFEKTVGYIFWAQKSGFRAEVILELDQIAIHPDFQGLGLSKKLIVESIKDIENELWRIIKR